MTKEKVITLEQALDYLIDCQLATVDDYAMKKSPPVGEFRRSVAIAQAGMNWLKKFNCHIHPSGRPFTVSAKHGGDVTQYAKTMRKKWNPKSRDLLANVKRVHPYQRRRTSITGKGL